MDQTDFDKEERAYLEARNKVSDEELVARMNGAPDMGGALLVKLSEFVSKRATAPVDGTGSKHHDQGEANSTLPMHAVKPDS